MSSGLNSESFGRPGRAPPILQIGKQGRRFGRTVQVDFAVKREHSAFANYEIARPFRWQ